MPEFYDVIVLGVGGVGSAAAWRLAARGARVLAIDAHHPPHNLGSSHGRTRAIRMAYFEHSDYVPLLRRAYTLWDELQDRVGQRLFNRCGLLQVGPANGRVVSGVLRAAAEHNLPVQQFTPVQARSAFPQFYIPEDASIVFESQAGYLRVDDCVAAQLRLATAAGAHLRFGEPVRSWQADGQGFVVNTDQGAYRATSLAICGGPWAAHVLPGLHVPLRVIRKSVYFFPEANDKTMSQPKCPVYFFETRQGFYYGFPALDSHGVKVGKHSGEGPEYGVPDSSNLEEMPEERSAVADFVANYLLRVLPMPHDRSDCWYTMSPDEHFLIDRVEMPGVMAYVAGLSGHGFKFVPVLGEILADLLLSGRSALPIAFLSAARFTSVDDRSAILK